MNKAAIHEASVFKLIILIACIVVAMFFATVLLALVFLPNQLITGLLSEDKTFLLPLGLSAVCSASVLAWYVRSRRSPSLRDNETGWLTALRLLGCVESPLGGHWVASGELPRRIKRIAGACRGSSCDEYVRHAPCLLVDHGLVWQGSCPWERREAECACGPLR